MKPNLFDRLVGFFSPEAGARRLRYRIQSEIAQRSYDGAQTYNWNDWFSAKSSSANAEIRKDLPKLRDRSRDLVRNSAYANRAVNVIVHNTIGAGIVPSIKGRNKSQTKAVQDMWKRWGETALCDVEGKNNFYGLQAIAVRTMVESGEILAKRSINEQVICTQLLEPDFINATVDEGNTYQGVEIDENGREIQYHIYQQHPGDIRQVNQKYIQVPAREIVRMLKRERPGQIRGVPWAYPVIETLNNLADLQKATLVRQKVSACYVAFITESQNDAVLPDAMKIAKRELESQLEPGSLRYLQQGQNVQFASPPTAQGYNEFNRECLKEIAAGFGVSYEALTGDYSNVNFSSGRMGHLEFQRNIEAWRWQVIIPQFCNPLFKWFLEWCELMGVKTDGITVEWTAPAREMIDPTKEIAAITASIRSGLKTLPEALREQGQDPDKVLQEIADSNAKLDALNIVLDSDPRKLTGQGMAQMNDPNNPPDTSDGATSTTGA